MPIAHEVYADANIQAFIDEANADPDVVGLLLGGSLAAGAIHPESDYDIAYVVTDEAYARYEATDTWPHRGVHVQTPKAKDLWHESLRGLHAAVEVGTGDYVDSEVLLDKTGELAGLLEAIQHMTEERARREVVERYNAYLNSLMRSCKAWRRGNDLGARVMAAESALCLLHTLFALERRWRPWNDRLWVKLQQLDRQGWAPGELRGILLDLISDGDPYRQQAIARRVIALLRERGFGYVYDDWNGEIDDVLSWTFPKTHGDLPG
jgi:hypothetical protein